MGDHLILAAGGIIERHTAEGLKIAVIYRTRYGGEWCLPKGKLKKGESPLEAAKREVKEETGCSVKVTDFAGSTSYFHDATPKVVLYWRMALAVECATEPTDREEVEKVEWLTPQEAIDRLKHDEEKEMVMQVLCSKAFLSRRGILRRIRGGLTRLFISRRWRRLASAITAYRVELGQRVSRCQETQAAYAWVGPAYGALCRAELALCDGDIDKGWKCFLAAQRMELFGLNPNEELQARVIVLREEAEKLSSWRKRAAYELLGSMSEGTPDVEKVYVAALLRDEHYSNQAYKDGLLRNHVARLVLILALLLSTLFALLWLEILPTPDVLEKAPPDYKEDLWMFLTVALFGLLGGTLSAMLKAPESTKSSRIPELTATTRITLLRLCMSAAAAIVIYVFLESDLSDPFLGSLEDIKPYTIFAVSFVAGFTERLVMRAVGHVAGK